MQIYTLQINAIFSLYYFQCTYVCYVYYVCTYILVVVIFILGLHFQSSSSTKYFLQSVCVAKCLSLARYFNNRKTHNKSTQALECNENEHCPQVLQYVLSLKHIEAYECAYFYLMLNTTFIRLTQNYYFVGAKESIDPILSIFGIRTCCQFKNILPEFGVWAFGKLQSDFDHFCRVR